MLLVWKDRHRGPSHRARAGVRLTHTSRGESHGTRRSIDGGAVVAGGRAVVLFHCHVGATDRRHSNHGRASHVRLDLDVSPPPRVPLLAGVRGATPEDVVGMRCLRVRLRRLPRRLPARVASYLVALALLMGLTRPAGTYFYCEAMGMLPLDPCVHAAATEGASDDPSLSLRQQRHDCCERITVASAPRGATPATPEIAPSALSAILPARAVPPSAWHALAVGSATVQWRVPPRPPGQACAQLMVFLT